MVSSTSNGLQLYQQPHMLSKRWGSLGTTLERRRNNTCRYAISQCKYLIRFSQEFAHPWDDVGRKVNVDL